MTLPTAAGNWYAEGAGDVGGGVVVVGATADVEVLEVLVVLVVGRFVAWEDVAGPVPDEHPNARRPAARKVTNMANIRCVLVDLPVLSEG